MACVSARPRLTSDAYVNPLYYGGEGGGTKWADNCARPCRARWSQLLVAAGAKVKKGTPALLILEAMKMEHTITAPSGGVVKQLRFAVGDQVGDGAELVEFEPEADE